MVETVGRVEGGGDMGDILDEAAGIANAAESAEQVRLIVDMMAASPQYTFVFLLAQPSLNGGTMVRQLSNGGSASVFWMLNVAAQAIMQEGQLHPDNS